MLVRFYYSYDRGTEAVDSIQSIVELYRFLLLLPERQLLSPEPRVLICVQAKLLYCFYTPAGGRSPPAGVS